VYYSPSNTNLQERNVDFSIPFLAVTNFRQPSGGHMIGRGIFAPRLGTVAPTGRWVKMSHWNINWFVWLVFKRQLVLYIRRCV